MPYTTLIATADLATQLANPSNRPNLVLLDCRFRLDDPSAGRQLFRDGHLPGARYAHLDDDLSGPIVPGETGRHPLPSADDFAATLAAWGVSNQGDTPTQVVAYDDAGGLFAARLWWMVRWLGHDRVAVLDGGWSKWLAEERPLESGDARPVDRATFAPQQRDEMLASVDDVLANVEHPTFALLDARDEARFRGEPNAMDPVPGHIPGATSAFYRYNLNDDGTFRDARRPARPLRRPCSATPPRAIGPTASSTPAAPASAPRTTFWRCSTPDWARRGRGYMWGRGASGSRTSRGRWRWGGSCQC